MTDMKAIVSALLACVPEEHRGTLCDVAGESPRTRLSEKQAVYSIIRGDSFLAVQARKIVQACRDDGVVFTFVHPEDSLLFHADGLADMVATAEGLAKVAAKIPDVLELRQSDKDTVDPHAMEKLLGPSFAYSLHEAIRQRQVAYGDPWKYGDQVTVSETDVVPSVAVLHPQAVEHVKSIETLFLKDHPDIEPSVKRIRTE